MRLWPIFLLALPEYHYHNLPVNADIIIRYPIGDSILAQMDRMILFKKVTCFRLLNFSHVMRTNQSKFSKFGRWKFIDHRFFSFFTDFFFSWNSTWRDIISWQSCSLLYTLRFTKVKPIWKVFKRGWAILLLTKKPLISWFNEHGHPAHHTVPFLFLRYSGSGKMTYFRAFKRIKDP